MRGSALQVSEAIEQFYIFPLYFKMAELGPEEVRAGVKSQNAVDLITWARPDVSNVSGSLEPSEKLAGIDDEENAKAIAEKDLHGPRKQVDDLESLLQRGVY